MSKAFIYYLADPRQETEPHSLYDELQESFGNDEICRVHFPVTFLRESYVGKTIVSLNKRLRKHLGIRKSEARSYRANWINKLQQVGVEPIIQPILEIDFDYVSVEEQTLLLDHLERHVISLFRSKGLAHTNFANGGNGFDSELSKRVTDMLGPEGRSARAKKIAANIGKERLSNIARKRNADMGEIARKERSKKSLETLGPEGRKRRALKASQTMGWEGNSARTTKAALSRNETPEQRKQRMQNAIDASYIKRGKTLPRGIFWNNQRQKFTARFFAYNQVKHIGQFETVEQAEAAINDFQQSDICRIWMENALVNYKPRSLKRAKS